MPPPPSSDKLDQFEKELRGDIMNATASADSQGEGTAAQPTKEQQKLIDRYDPQTRNFNYYRSQLADYSFQLDQMSNDHHRASASMQLSTLENQRQGGTTAPQPDEFQMLTTQPNMQKISDASVKKAKKAPKLSGIDSWL